MEQQLLNFELSFNGSMSDKHIIDLYDVSEALKGFHRTLALTSHLVLHSEVITQAPSAKGLNIYAYPSEEGSWKILASLAIAGQFLSTGLTAPQNTVIGHIFFSAYDYVVSESLGFDVDYNKSLGKLYREHQNLKLPIINESQLDSIVEKTQNSFIEMHRPIYKTQTANQLTIKVYNDNEILDLNSKFNMESYIYMTEHIIDSNIFTVTGVVTSYNSNTYKGRIFIKEISRPIPFELGTELKNKKHTLSRVIRSLETHALHKEHLLVTMEVKAIKSIKGRLKGYLVQKVWKESLNN